MKRGAGLLTSTAAGARIGRSPSAIRAATARGTLTPTVTASDGARLYHPDTIDHYAARRERRATNGKGQ